MIASQEDREHSLRPVPTRVGTLSRNLVDDCSVITVKEFALITGLSMPTARRLIRGGGGPVVTRLSARRIGIRRRDLAQWLDDRRLNPSLPRRVQRAGSAATASTDATFVGPAWETVGSKAARLIEDLRPYDAGAQVSDAAGTRKAGGGA